MTGGTRKYTYYYFKLITVNIFYTKYFIKIVNFFFLNENMSLVILTDVVWTDVDIHAQAILSSENSRTTTQSSLLAPNTHKRKGTSSCFTSKYFDLHLLKNLLRRRRWYDGDIIPFFFSVRVFEKAWSSNRNQKNKPSHKDSIPTNDDGIVVTNRTRTPELNSRCGCCVSIGFLFYDTVIFLKCFLLSNLAL
jgi:hypothetical protein